MQSVEKLIVSVGVPIITFCPLDRLLLAVFLLYWASWYFGFMVPSPSQLLWDWALFPFIWGWHKVGDTAAYRPVGCAPPPGTPFVRWGIGNIMV